MIESYSYTNTGNRETNEDYVLSKEIGENISLHIVADGMGGYMAGDIASMTIAETMCQSLEHGADIKDAATAANYALGKKKIELSVSKIGSTIAGVLLNESKADIFWCGDSRVYIFRAML